MGYARVKGGYSRCKQGSMADSEVRKCAVCCTSLLKQYRALRTHSSNCFKKYFEELHVRFEGYMCYRCCNKMNKLIKLDMDIETKFERLKCERLTVFNCLKEISASFQTPRKAPKRQNPFVSPCPRGACKTPARSPSTKSFRRILPFLSPLKSCTESSLKAAEDSDINPLPVSLNDKDNRHAPATATSHDVQISVTYAGKPRTMNVKDPTLQRVCRAIYNRLSPLKIVQAFNNGIYIDALLETICENLRKEIKNICKENQDFLKGSNFMPSSIIWKTLWDKLKQLSPTLHKFLEKGISKDDNTDLKKKLPIVCTAAATILYGRNQKLSYLQYAIGLIVDRCGLSTEGVSLLHSLGLSVAQTSLSRKKKACIDLHRESLQKMVTSHLERFDSGKAIEENVSTKVAENNVALPVLKQETQNSGEELQPEAVSSVTKIEVLGDNVDILVSPGTITSDRQRKSWHWFLTLVTEKRVTDSSLPCDKPLRNVQQVDTSEWIPSTADMATHHAHLEHHIATILVKYITCLHAVSNSLPKCIKHAHMSKTSQKSKFLIADLIDANENTAEGMVSILNKVHELAVPHVGNQVLERVVFGGDVLTNERAFTAQESRQNASTDMDSLKGIIHRPEGLHRQMNFLVSIYQLFYKEKSSGESGTLYQLRNMLNRRDVSGPKEVTVNFRSHFNFIEDVMEGCIVGEFLNIHNMEDMNSTPCNLPVWSLLTEEQTYKWILQQAKTIIENLQVSDTSHIETLKDRLKALNHDDRSVSDMWNGTQFQCAICNKGYKKEGWFRTHLVKIHGWQFSKESTEKPEQDDVTGSFLRMALLLHDTYDAYRYCDGDRIFLNAKLEWLYAGATHHTKYKLWLWRMLTYDMAILTPREAFEYRWNTCVNLSGGMGNNIPNDNCVEICVHKIKSQLMTQGPNKSFESARAIAMSSQVLDTFKEIVMKESGAFKGSGKRTAVDRSVDVGKIALATRSRPITSSKTFAKFREPIHRLQGSELHLWIQEQKLICSKLM